MDAIISVSPGTSTRQAFRTLTVSADEADVDFGDGDLWVERLGGEENFVQPIRRKFREMQRRAITDRDSAVIDSILQARTGQCREHRHAPSIRSWPWRGSGG